MSLFRNSLRPPAVLSDEAVERYVAALKADVDPDPAFRRRLRGVILNQYVASREAGLAGSVPKAMGRLGRAVLYASFILGVSVTGVMAASDVAVPGDVLYPLKRGIEDLRVEVLPEQFTERLVIAELNERFAELAILAQRQETDRVEMLAEEVATEYASVIIEARTDGEPLDRRTHVLEELIARLPDQARVALDHALSAPGALGGPGRSGGGAGSDGAGPAAPATEPGGSSAGKGPGTGQGSGNGNGSGSANGSGTGNGAGNGNANGAANGNGNGSANGNANGAANGNGTGTGSGAEDSENAGAEEADPTGTPTTEPSPTPKPKKSPKP